MGSDLSHLIFGDPMSFANVHVGSNLLKAAKVITLRSWADNLSSREQTSPNKASSFNSSNLGAKFPRLSRPAVAKNYPFEVAKYNYLTLERITSLAQSDPRQCQCFGD